jgi:peptidyl-prolyl cis-trans isomerase D
MMKDFSLTPKRILYFVLIVLLGLVFGVQWGPGAGSCAMPGAKTAPTAAATVNGTEITLREFARAYTNQLEYFRSQGSAIPDTLARQLGLPTQVLDQLITRELVSQEAERQGITASDTEVRDVIWKSPEFQVNGKFDEARYREIVSTYLRRTLPEYENELRRWLGAQKLLETVVSSVVVSDDEVKSRFFKEGNKAELTYVRFLPSFYLSRFNPSAAELAAFKKGHPKEIEAFYSANRAQYDKPERVRARHILLKVEKEDPAEKRAQIKEKLEALRKEIEGGKDFAQVAKASSEDAGSKDKGGDLGFGEKTTWVPEFSAVAFSLKPGELSQPVESPFGYHLIQVQEKQPEQKKELKAVEDEIAKQLLKVGKAKEMAKAEAQKALAALKSGKKLTALYPPEKDNQPAAQRFETETRPEAVATGEFGPGAAIPQLGAAPELSADAFAADGPKRLDKVYSVGEGYAIAEVTARKKPTEEQFVAQKDKLRDGALKGKGTEVRESYLKSLKKTAEIVTHPEVVDQVVDRS